MQTILKIAEQTQQTGLEETCKEELLALRNFLLRR
jgi:hypothetical protein